MSRIAAAPTSRTPRKSAGPAARWAECVVVLVRPESPENIGLAARAMKNTGFSVLRLAGLDGLGQAAFRTAVHAGDILSSGARFPDLAAAVSDLNVVFASTARRRQNFSVLDFEEAVTKLMTFGPPARIGLVFGNERTGLTSGELGYYASAPVRNRDGKDRDSGYHDALSPAWHATAWRTALRCRRTFPNHDRFESYRARLNRPADPDAVKSTEGREPEG